MEIKFEIRLSVGSHALAEIPIEADCVPTNDDWQFDFENFRGVDNDGNHLPGCALIIGILNHEAGYVGLHRELVKIAWEQIKKEKEGFRVGEPVLDWRWGGVRC